MNVLSCIIILTLISFILFSSKRVALLGMVIGYLFLSQGAGFDLLGFSFFPTRLLGYVCFLRVLLRKEFYFGDLLKPDKILICLYVFITLILFTRIEEESPALRVAKLCDTIFTYISFRALIGSPGDLRWLLEKMVVLLIPYVVALGIEGFLGRNLFEWVGAGGKEWFRGSNIRCFGSFRHPSLLGSLGACFFPLFVSLAWSPGLRQKAIMGVILCMAIVGFSNSGGPVSVLAFSIGGWFLWGLRMKMKMVRWSALAFVLVLAIFMKAPVWYLLARVSSITGGTGWHRSYLLEVAFKHIGEWWLFGAPVLATKDWFPYVVASTGGADITNQFIEFGLQGGLLAILGFGMLIIVVLGQIGSALRQVRLRSNSDNSDEALLWGLGVCLSAHISNWMGITYFDQFAGLWLLQLAAMVTVADYFSHSDNEGEINESSPVSDSEDFGTKEVTV